MKQAVKVLKSTSARSIRSSEWSEADGVLYFCGKIYVPPTADIQQKIVALHHDSHVAGHPGRWKTLELVARNYWWPHMSRYIGQYTATCNLCLWTKVLRQPPTGHLESLPTPDIRWDTVSVDFIVELPESDGYNAIMVVVDSLCKRAHFLPVNTTITAVGSARQFRDNVWKLVFGSPVSKPEKDWDWTGPRLIRTAKDRRPRSSLRSSQSWEFEDR